MVPRVEYSLGVTESDTPTPVSPAYWPEVRRTYFHYDMSQSISLVKHNSMLIYAEAIVHICFCLKGNILQYCPQYICV